MQKKSLTKYWLIFRLAIQEVFQYRFDFFMSNVKYMLSILMMTFVWIAVANNSNSVSQSVEELSSYFVVAALIYSLSNFHPFQIEEDIKLGGLSKYLIKPINPQLNYFAQQLAKVILESVLKFVILIPAFFFFSSLLKINLNLLLFFLYLPSIFLFSYLWLTTISQLTFWITDAYSIRWSTTISTRLLAGLFAPIYFFPDWYQKLSFYFPFQYLGFIPIQTALGKTSIQQALEGLIILWVWTFVIFFFNQLEWNQGVKNYEGTGI